MSTPNSEGEGKRREGLLSRHPRLGVLLIGALFLVPICAMALTVAILIIGRS